MGELQEAPNHARTRRHPPYPNHFPPAASARQYRRSDAVVGVDAGGDDGGGGGGGGGGERGRAREVGLAGGADGEALELWSLEAIEEALGADAGAVLPASIRLTDVHLRLPRY